MLKARHLSHLLTHNAAAGGSRWLVCRKLFLDFSRLAMDVWLYVGGRGRMSRKHFVLILFSLLLLSCSHSRSVYAAAPVRLSKSVNPAKHPSKYTLSSESDTFSTMWCSNTGMTSICISPNFTKTVVQHSELVLLDDSTVYFDTMRFHHNIPAYEPLHKINSLICKLIHKIVTVCSCIQLIAMPFMFYIIISSYMCFVKNTNVLYYFHRIITSPSASSHCVSWCCRKAGLDNGMALYSSTAGLWGSMYALG